MQRRYTLVTQVSLSRWADTLQMKETPLSRAAHNGHLQMVRYLVEQGADVNCLDLVSNYCAHQNAEMNMS